MPKAKRGIYDELECLQWYVRYLQDKLKGGGAGTGTGVLVNSAKERYDIARARREERADAKDARELVAIADWERALAEIVTPARHELLAIEARLRPILGPEAASRVGVEIKRSLRGLGEPAPLPEEA
jgi:hypothetical protein